MSPRSAAPTEEQAAAELESIGYAGDAKTYRLRLATTQRLAEHGVGPGAYLQRFLAACRGAREGKPA